MKKLFAIMMGVMILLLAACAGGSETGEASSEEGQDQSENQGSEVDMNALIEQISMDATIETTEDTANFEFSLKNNGEEAVNLGFTSSQKYEIKVTNEKGESVYTFSANKMFTQEMTTKELASGDKWTVTETWTGIEEPGEYEATITFLVNTINDQPVESEPFQMTKTFTIEEKSSSNEESSDETNVRKYEGDGEAFRNIEVSGDKGNYVIKGEARVFEGNFMYSVEDGHHVLIEPKAVQVKEGEPAWSHFELKLDIPEEDLPDFGSVTLTLFEKSAKDGEPVNMNYIPLDTMGE